MPGYRPIGTAKVIILFRGRDQTPRLAAGVRHIKRETTDNESRRPLTGTRFGCSANRWRQPTKAVSCLKLLTLSRLRWATLPLSGCKHHAIKSFSLTR